MSLHCTFQISIGYTSVDYLGGSLVQPLQDCCHKFMTSKKKKNEKKK